MPRGTPNKDLNMPKIVDAKLIITSPGRNFVTLKLTTIPA